MNPDVTIAPEDLTKQSLQLMNGQGTEKEKGFVFTANDLYNIKSYTKYGLSCPKTIPLAESFLGYSQSDTQIPTGIDVQSMVNLYVQIYDNSYYWENTTEGLSKDASLDMKNYANEYISNVTDITDIINEMPVAIRAKQTVGGTTQTFPYTQDDQAIQESLLDILKDLQVSTTKRKEKATEVKNSVNKFRMDIVNNISPSVDQKRQIIKVNNLQQLSDDLSRQIDRLQEEIDQLKKDYDKYVGLCFTGAAGGIIGLAITGGIFGSKAEAARKERNAKLDQMDALKTRLGTTNALIRDVNELGKNMDGLATRLMDVISGAQNLEFVWKNMESIIADTVTKLNSCNEGTKLILFQTRLKSTIDPWKEVLGIANQLADLFTSALERIKQDLAKK